MVTRKVAIITDSAADLPQEIALQRSIRVVPLYVTLGDDTFKDGVELTPDELYSKMKFDKAVPRTSQPSPEDFRQAFEESAQPQILCLTISANLSGTLQSAELSKQLLSESVQVTTYNTRNASLGEGLKVLIADDLAEKGLSVCEITNRLDTIKLRTIFTVEHLQYLERGGRISKAQATMAAVLDIKPIL
ncbi:MAG: DegV family protein, partial [Bacillota bacterium]|nr:DegV family protein [Bacillota bacterium]